MDSMIRGALGVPLALRVAVLVVLGVVASATFAESANAGAITGTSKAVLVLGGPERNDIVFTTRQLQPPDQGALIRVTDRLAPLQIVPGAPCHPVIGPTDPNTVECRTDVYGLAEAQLFLGAGDDTVRAPIDSPYDQRYTRHYVEAYVDGGEGKDNITGTHYDDDLKGGNGPDKIDGREGNDHLDGGAGRDVLKGGFGNDTIMARDGAVDVVKCGDGIDLAKLDYDRFSACELF